MPEIYYVERGGRRYAYKSSSVYEPGSKYPRTVNEYIGRIDEETGKIIPKKTKAVEPKLSDWAGLKAKRHGASHALFEIAKECGLREDLFNSYGGDGERVLASAVAQALSGGPMSSAEDTIEGSTVRELLGIGGSFTSPQMSLLTQALGGNTGGLETLFEKRIGRAGDVLCYDITSVSTNSRLSGWGEWGHNRDGEKMPQMNIGLITDRRGRPAGFETYPGSIADVATLRRTVERLKALGAGKCVLAMDRGFGSASNQRDMIADGISYVIPAKAGTKCVKELVTQLVKEEKNPDAVMVHGGTAYSVVQTKAAVVRKKKPSDEDGESDNTRELEIILENDPRFPSVPENETIDVHACYDAKKASDERNRMQIALMNIESKLRGMDPWEAVRNVKKTAGGYAKFFELRVEDDCLVIERKRNSVSFAMNREGIFVMFSRNIGTWEEMMSVYDCRMYVEQAFDVLKNELDGNRWRTSDPMTAKGRLVIKFAALILWQELLVKLRDAGIQEPVSSVLQSLDNIMAVGTGTEWRTTEISKKNRTVLERTELPRIGPRLVLEPYQYIPEVYLQN